MYYVSLPDTMDTRHRTKVSALTLPRVLARLGSVPPHTFGHTGTKGQGGQGGAWWTNLFPLQMENQLRARFQIKVGKGGAVDKAVCGSLWEASKSVHHSIKHMLSQVLVDNNHYSIKPCNLTKCRVSKNRGKFFLLICKYWISPQKRI